VESPPGAIFISQKGMAGGLWASWPSFPIGGNVVFVMVLARLRLDCLSLCIIA
jgi:hypothetical protein